MRTENWSKQIPAEYSFLKGVMSDHSEILELSKRFDLDVLEFNIRDFCVVRKQSRVVGFGRLRPYPGFKEVATVGVVEDERSKGIGSAVVNCLVDGKDETIFLACVIPDFFARLGFKEVKDFPGELTAKINFCHSFGYKRNEVHVMKLER